MIPSLKRATIEELKLLIGQRHEVSPLEHYIFSMWPEGIPRGVLMEINGIGKTQAMVKFLEENSKVKAAWVEEELSVYPCAVAQKNVSLSRLLFIEASHDVLWASLQALRSQLFKCVIISIKKLFDERSLRRLQLEAEKREVNVFLLTEIPQKRAWPVALQVRVKERSLVKQ